MFEWTVSLGNIVSLAALGTTVIGVIYAIFNLGWKIRDMLGDFKATFTNKLDEHENKDQERHLQNIERFSGLEIRLARMGNGTYSQT